MWRFLHALQLIKEKTAEDAKIAEGHEDSVGVKAHSRMNPLRTLRALRLMNHLDARSIEVLNFRMKQESFAIS